MSRNLISKLLLAAAVIPGIILASGDARAISKDEVVSLAVVMMVPEADIIAQIEADRSVFNLSISDILELRKAGVPDGVIKFMMSTPTRYAAPAPAPAAPATAQQPSQQTAAPVAPLVREKTPEELEAERQAAAVEAERRAIEAKQAEEARRKAYATGKLKKGLELAETGRWVEAIVLFQSFLKEENYAEDSIEVYNAKYGMAAALTNAGLYQSAARLLVEVLLQGQDKPFFQDAFKKLRVLRREVIYNPHELEMLTSFPVVGFSDAFQAEFNYVMGEYFYDIGDYERAVNHLSRVGVGNPDAAKAKYLVGLVQVRNSMYKSAVESFQEAVTLSEDEKNGDPSVRDLAYMGLARIAYEAENHDAAIFYYKKVPGDSPRAGTVFYELAWTYLMKGDYSRALGAFHAIRSPYFDDAFIPELWIMEARVYGDLCYYDKSSKALDMFDSEIAVHQVPLRRFMDAQPSLEAYYFSFLKSVNAPDEKSLPRDLTLPVMQNVEFYNLYRTVRQIEKETQLIKDNAGQLGEFATEMLGRLDTLHKDNVVRCGVTIQRILKGVEADIERSQIHQTEIQVDISGAEIDALNQELRVLSGEEEQTGSTTARRSEIVIGGDTEVWPFIGEFWLDEVPYFRSSLVSKCVEY